MKTRNTQSEIKLGNGLGGQNVSPTCIEGHIFMDLRVFKIKFLGCFWIFIPALKHLSLIFHVRQSFQISAKHCRSGKVFAHAASIKGYCAHRSVVFRNLKGNDNINDLRVAYLDVCIISPDSVDPDLRVLGVPEVEGVVGIRAVLGRF